MGSDPVINLLDQWRGGDHQAANELFRLHAARLVALARSRLSDKLAGRVDAEDVVQSAYRSFFVRARDGEFDLRQGADLWALLVAITIHKVHQQVKRNTAGKRTVALEENYGSEDSLAGFQARPPTGEPSPLEAVALVDQVEEVMRGLDPVRRRVLELRLQGYTLEEIATDSGLSRRTLRRFLDQVREQLERRHTEDG
jgi:RNA polymerase sigma factor (sigma-70 family)